MTTFRKPSAGEPANLILGETFQAALVDVVNAYNRGELTTKPTEFRKDHVVMVKNISGSDVKAGEMLATAADIQPPTYDDTVQSFMQNPLTEGSAVSWHGNIGYAAVAVQPILNGMIGPCAFRPWGQVQADIGGAGDWLMINPANPKEFKYSTGGVARVINADNTTGKCVADFRQQQPLWRYELLSDVANLLGVAHLIDLGGAIYATATIRFTNSTKVAGDAGFCIHTGNHFDAIESAPTVASAPTPRFRFRLKTDFNDTGVATAYVLDVFGNVTNPDGSPVELNDVLTVHDPRKCFAHAVGADSLAAIEAVPSSEFVAGGSIGYAVKTNQLKATPSDPSDNQYPRWEVEQCTQTVQRMVVRIDSSLNLTAGVNETQPTGKLNESQKRLFFNASQAILSRWPDVDYAPEWTECQSEGYEWEILVTNPHRFSAGDGWAIIERNVDKSRVENAINVNTPYIANTAGTVQWQIVEVQNPIARWQQVSWGGASQGWAATAVIAEGEKTSNVSYRFDDMGTIAGHVRDAPGLTVGCLNVGETGWAFWDPNEQFYNVIVTESALLGAPVTIEPVATGPNSTLPMAEFDACDLILRKLGPVKVFGGKDECQFSQSSLTVAASLTAVDVVAGVTRVGEELCFNYDTVYVCRTDTGVSDDCLNVCCPETTGCCEYPPGTYTDGVTQSACDLQGGTWTAADCPGDDCYACSFCDTAGGGATITLQQFSFDPGGSVTQGGQFSLSSMTQTSGCTALATGYFTPLGGGTQTPATCTMTLQSDSSSSSGYSIRCVWSPSQVYGCTLDADLYSGAQTPQPDPCSDVYGLAAGGVNPANPPEGNTWTAYDAATSPCTP